MTKVCPKGHTFFKTSDCPVCPICEGAKAKARTNDPFPGIGAPAHRALETINVKTLKQLSKYTDKEILALHGVGPKAIRLLMPLLEAEGLSFKKL